MTRRAIQGGEVRRVLQGDIVIDLRQQYPTETFGQGDQARILGATRLAEALDLALQRPLAGGNLIALDGIFALTLQQLLHLIGDGAAIL